MKVKPPKVKVEVEVHTRPNSPDSPAVRPDHVTHVDLPPPTIPPRRPDITTQTPDLDAITAAPGVTVTVSPSHAITVIPVQRPLRDYRLPSTLKLPAPDADGVRTVKGRLFVDIPDGVVHIGLDPQSGLYRAKLAKESKASGPLLLQEPHSKRWFPLDEDMPTTFPLSASRLEPFPAGVDLNGVLPDGNGLYPFEGRLYAFIDNHAYQVMQDVDASSPERKVWRVVNAKDSVARDSDNIYHASRSGENLAITRSADDVWVHTLVGLAGGMRRNPSSNDNKILLLQRYEPISKANNDLVQSNARFNQLRDQSIRLEDGPAKTAALVALEVHIRKHIRMQGDFVKMYIDHKDWLVYLKAGGLYKQELYEQQMLRVDYMGKLMATMDLRAAPIIAANSLEASKQKLVLLDKKLLVLQERQIIVDQIKKTFRDVHQDIEEHDPNLPDLEKININKFHCYLQLLTGDVDTLPSVGHYSMSAMRAMDDMKGASIPAHPLAMRVFLDQVGMEKNRFERLLMSEPAEKAQYIKQIIPLLESFEARIDKQLTEHYQQLKSNSDLPAYDQDIDFDFLPAQPKDSPSIAPRKMFRTREHGTYKVLVGEQETAADGSVTVKVADPYKPNDPPQRYEKRQGEWRPVTASSPVPAKARLISDANQSLGLIDEHLRAAQAQEQQKANPTNIVEFLGAKADRLDQLARWLGDTQGTTKDASVTGLIDNLTAASLRLNSEGQQTLVRMYKSREVLDILRLNYLLDRAELSATRTVERKPLGKGKNKSFLDVYSIKDRASDEPLWEAHFHYDKQDSPALNFTVRGGHLKTLEQAGRGMASQRRDEQAGLPHVAIWRETFDGRTARKIFDLAV